MRSQIAIAAVMVITSNAAAQVVDHYYLDPQNVDQISKFRSCAGHHYGYNQMFIDLGLYEVETDPTETNRSMKHYFSPLESFRTNGSNNTLEVYAPFDGTIYRVTDEGHDSGYVNKQVWIQSSVSPDIFAILFHVNLLDVFPDYWNDYPAEYWSHHGADDANFDRLTVSSGEVIGYVDLRGTISDIAILKKINNTEYHYLSYFDETVMTEPVFANYRQYDLTSRDDVIISREFVNSHPLPEDCWDSRREEDWFSLTTIDDGDEVNNIVDNDLSPPSLTAFLNLFSSVQSFLGTNSKATSSRAPASRHVDDHRKEPQEIPTIPMLNIIILSGLLGLFGIRRFACR